MSHQTMGDVGWWSMFRPYIATSYLYDGLTTYFVMTYNRYHDGTSVDEIRYVVVECILSVPKVL